MVAYVSHVQAVSTRNRSFTAIHDQATAGMELTSIGRSEEDRRVRVEDRDSATYPAHVNRSLKKIP